MQQPNKWIRALWIGGRCAAGAGLALAAALLLFPLPAKAASAPARIDSVNVSKTDLAKPFGRKVLG